jgi:hypothetical protein
VDDEPDVADLFRQQFRREVRDGIYVVHFASSAQMLYSVNQGVWIHTRGRQP